jgi:hypothetical protein
VNGNPIGPNEAIEQAAVVGAVCHLLRQRGGNGLERQVDLDGDLGKSRTAENNLARRLAMSQLEGSPQDDLGRCRVEVLFDSTWP